MNWPNRVSICLVGFAVGFIAMGLWHYLYWTSFASALLAGATVAVLCGAIWAGQDVVPRAVRAGAIALLVCLVLSYGFFVYNILSVSDCGFMDGRLYCLSRSF